MARRPFEEFTRVTLIPGHDAVDDITGPTTAELTDQAALDVTCQLTDDGLDLSPTTAMIDGGGLCSRVVSQTPGNVTYGANLRFYREDDDDVAWDVVEWGAEYTMVVRTMVPYSEEYADGQDVGVYLIRFGEPVPATSAGNTFQTFQAPVAVQGAEQKAVVGGAGS